MNEREALRRLFDACCGLVTIGQIRAGLGHPENEAEHAMLEALRCADDVLNGYAEEPVGEHFVP